MKKKKAHTISSSDEESTSKKKSKKTRYRIKSKLFNTILENDKVTQFKFNCWKSCQTLFYNDITEDDEVWLVQCPKNTDITHLNKVSLDFDSAVSNVKCRVNGTKEKLTVYSIDDHPSQINLALPNRPTKSFELKTVPVAGQLILQKNIRVKRKHVNDEDVNNSLIDVDISELKSESESYDEPKIELLTPKKKPRNHEK